MVPTPTQPDDRADVISTFIESMNPTELDLWTDLDALSTRTEVEGVEAPVEGVIVKPDGRFSAVANLYVVLRYGKNDEDSFAEADSFVARINGHMDGERPVIDSSSVDTSDFYG